MERRQGGSDGAHIADGTNVNMTKDGNGGNNDDGDEGGWNGGGQIREEINDDDAKENEGDHGPAFSFKVAKLGGEDEDGKGVDEADLHGIRDEFDEVADAEDAKNKHDDTTEDGGKHEILWAMVAYKADDDESHGTSGGRDHGGATAEEGEKNGEPEGGIQAHHGADAGDDTEADDFRNDGERGDEAGEDVATNVAEPFLFFFCNLHEISLPLIYL